MLRPTTRSSAEAPFGSERSTEPFGSELKVELLGSKAHVESLTAERLGRVDLEFGANI